MRPSVVVIAFVVCAGAAAVARAQSGGARSWAVRPVDEYRALRERAFPVRAPTPPVDAALTRVDFDLCITGAAVATLCLPSTVLRGG